MDDVCALAMVLNWPQAELLAITTVAEHQGKRAGYARYALALLAGRTSPSRPAQMPLWIAIAPGQACQTKTLIGQNRYRPFQLRLKTPSISNMIRLLVPSH
jgi:hypothetical protein